MHYRRVYTPGAHYFFTVVTEQRNPLLIKHIDRLRHAFRKVIHTHPFELEAICVLPDHLHTMWKMPSDDENYSLRWNLIKRNFSSGIDLASTSDSKTRKREKGVWQRRFWEHQIRDERDWRNHVDYIHYNPVKHGLVERVGDWPHSSFHRFVRRGWYEENWGEVSAEVKGMEFE